MVKLLPIFDQPPGGSRAQDLIKAARRSPVVEMETGEGKFFDGKWVVFPYVSIRTERSGWLTARLRNFLDVEKLALAIEKKN